MNFRWSLYYGDGSRYDGITSEHAFEAPTENLQLVKQEADNDRGFTQRRGSSFYCWERVIRSDGGPCKLWRWSGKGDHFGLQDYYHYHKGAQKVVTGREIHDETYHEISRQAVADGRFDDMNFQPGKLVKG